MTKNPTPRGSRRREESLCCSCHEADRRSLLTSLPEGLTSIGDRAFSGCDNLALASLPERLTSIGYGAFQGCTNLALASLPEGITSIGDWAFWGCTSLAVVTCPAITPPELGGNAFGDESEFGGIPSLRFKVPAESVDAYKNPDPTISKGWSVYADKISAIGTLTSIAEITTYLTNAQNGATVNDPVSLSVDMDLQGSGRKR